MEDDANWLQLDGADPEIADCISPLILIQTAIVIYILDNDRLLR